MPDLWWPILIGTLGALILGVALISSFIFLRKTRVQSQQEKRSIIVDNEKKYSSLFNTVSDIVYIHKVDGTIVEINETAARVLETGVGSIVGRNIMDIPGLGKSEEVKHYLAKFRNGEREVQGIFPFINRNQLKVILLDFRSSLVIDSNGAVSVQGIARNVTDQKGFERSLLKRERQMKLLYEKAEMMRENLRLVSMEMLKVQEDERRKIGRELHDEIGQLLATIKVNLELMKKNFSLQDESAVKAKISDTEKVAGEMFGRIRQFLKELRPLALSEMGILSSIERLLKEYTERTGIETYLTDDNSDIESLNNEKKTVLFRVIQESLTNIAKHAQARVVTVELRKDDGNILVDVVDDGKGFEIEKVESPRHDRGMGLLGMQERVNLVHGEFRVMSTPGHGTSVQAKIPIGEHEALKLS